MNLIYTGQMEVLHMASAQNLPMDTYVTSPSFTELGIKSSYTFTGKKSRIHFQVFGGVKNLFNAYQNDFDIGKERDSNYIYGPAVPRTVFVGIKLGSNL